MYEEEEEEEGGGRRDARKSNRQRRRRRKRKQLAVCNLGVSWVCVCGDMLQTKSPRGWGGGEGSHLAALCMSLMCAWGFRGQGLQIGGRYCVGATRAPEVL